MISNNKLISSQLHGSIEKTIATYHTVDGRPPAACEEAFADCTRIHADMMHSVSPVYEEFKDMLTNNLKPDSPYNTGLMAMEDGHCKQFIGVKRGDNLYAGKSYIFKDDRIMAATYGLFNYEADQEESYRGHGYHQVDYHDLKDEKKMDFEFVKLEDARRPRKYLSVASMLDGAIKYQMIEDEKPAENAFTFIISSKGVVRIVQKVKDNLHKVWAIRHSEECDSVEQYFVDDGNSIIQNSEQVKYDSIGRYWHRVEGQGNCILQPNLRYEGFISEGFKLSGEGKMLQIAPRIVVSGVFEDGKITAGLIQTPDFTYEGGIKDMKAEGEGRMTFINHDVAEGSFVVGKQEGRGKFYSHCCESNFQGQFKNNLKTGKGVEVFKNGDKYEGEFVQGVFSGKGVLNFANGDVYNGQFDEGVFHGDGELKTSDTLLKCKWTHGYLGERNEDHIRKCCSGHISPTNKKRMN